MGGFVMVFCATNIFIELFKGNEDIIKNINSISPNNLCTSVICLADLYYGALNKKELRSISNDLGNIKHLQIEPSISEMAIDLMQQFIMSHKVGYADFLIAATCLHHKLELYTLNKKDFRFIPGIKFYK